MEAMAVELNHTILDTRGPVAHRLADRDDLMFPLWEPPVGLSPDGNRFARLATIGSSDALVIAVTDLDGANPVTMDIDPVRMPYAAREDIGPAWVLRYFEWAADASGTWQLVERKTP